MVDSVETCNECWENSNSGGIAAGMQKGAIWRGMPLNNSHLLRTVFYFISPGTFLSNSVYMAAIFPLRRRLHRPETRGRPTPQRRIHLARQKLQQVVASECQQTVAL